MITTNNHCSFLLTVSPFVLQENLFESKHHKMARSLRTGPRDRDLKPDAKTRDLLKVPSCHLPMIVIKSIFDAVANSGLMYEFRILRSKSSESVHTTAFSVSKIFGHKLEY